MGAAVGEGLGEGAGVGVGEGVDDFGSCSPVFSLRLAIVFVSACEADFFSAFFGSIFSADFFSLLLLAASLSFVELAPRESPDVLPVVLPGAAPDVLPDDLPDIAPDVMPDVMDDATATIFSPGFRSTTLRGLVATCGTGGGFAVTAEGLGPVALTVLNATGLSGVVVLGAPGWVGPRNCL